MDIRVVQRSSRRIRTFVFVLILCSVNQVFRPVYGQWAQTLGWGGAGYGKRSSTLRDPIRDVESHINPRLIKTFRDVLQLIVLENTVTKKELFAKDI